MFCPSVKNTKKSNPNRLGFLISSIVFVTLCVCVCVCVCAHANPSAESARRDSGYRSIHTFITRQSKVWGRQIEPRGRVHTHTHKHTQNRNRNTYADRQTDTQTHTHTHALLIDNNYEQTKLNKTCSCQDVLQNIPKTSNKCFKLASQKAEAAN